MIASTAVAGEGSHSSPAAQARVLRTRSSLRGHESVIPARITRSSAAASDISTTSLESEWLACDQNVLLSEVTNEDEAERCIETPSICTSPTLRESSDIEEFLPLLESEVSVKGVPDTSESILKESCESISNLALEYETAEYSSDCETNDLSADRSCQGTEEMAGNKEDKKKVLELMSLNFNSTADVEKAKELISETLAANEKKATTRKTKKRRLEMLLEMSSGDDGGGKEGSKYSLLKTNPITHALKKVRKEPQQNASFSTAQSSLATSATSFLGLTPTDALFCSAPNKPNTPSLRSLKSLSPSASAMATLSGSLISTTLSPIGSPSGSLSSTTPVTLLFKNTPITISAPTATTNSVKSTASSLSVKSVGVAPSVPALARVRRGMRRSASDKESGEDTTSLSEASEAESCKTDDDGGLRKKRIRRSLPVDVEAPQSTQVTVKNEKEQVDIAAVPVKAKGSKARSKAAVDLILQGKSTELDEKPLLTSRLKARSRLSLPYVMEKKESTTAAASHQKSQKLAKSINNVKKGTSARKKRSEKVDKVTDTNLSEKESVTVEVEGTRTNAVNINNSKQEKNSRPGRKRQKKNLPDDAKVGTDLPEVRKDAKPQKAIVMSGTRRARKSRLSTLTSELKQEANEEGQQRRSRSSTPVLVRVTRPCGRITNRRESLDSLASETDSVNSVTGRKPKNDKPTEAEAKDETLQPETDTNKRSGKRKKKHFRGLRYSFNSSAEKRRKIARDAARRAAQAAEDLALQVGDRFPEDTIKQETEATECPNLELYSLANKPDLTPSITVAGIDSEDKLSNDDSIKVSIEEGQVDNVNVISCTAVQDGVHTNVTSAELKDGTPLRQTDVEESVRELSFENSDKSMAEASSKSCEQFSSTPRKITINVSASSDSPLAIISLSETTDSRKECGSSETFHTINNSCSTSQDSFGKETMSIETSSDVESSNQTIAATQKTSIELFLSPGASLIKDSTVNSDESPVSISPVKIADQFKTPLIGSRTVLNVPKYLPKAASSQVASLPAAASGDTSIPVVSFEDASLPATPLPVTSPQDTIPHVKPPAAPSLITQPSEDFLRGLSLVRTEDYKREQAEAVKRAGNRPKVDFHSFSTVFYKKKKNNKLKRNNEFSQFEDKKAETEVDSPYTFVASPPKVSKTVIPLRIRTGDQASPAGSSLPYVMRTTRRKAFVNRRRSEELPLISTDSDASTSHLAATDASPVTCERARETHHEKIVVSLSKSKILSSSVLNDGDKHSSKLPVEPSVSPHSQESHCAENGPASLVDGVKLSNADAFDAHATPYLTERQEVMVNGCTNDHVPVSTTTEKLSANGVDNNVTGSIIIEGGVRKSRRIGQLHHTIPVLPPHPLVIATPAGGKEDNDTDEGFADGSYAIVLCRCRERVSPRVNLPSGPVYCQAIDSFDGRMLGCCNVISKNTYLRVSAKIPFLLLCDIHRQRLRRHNCCPGCGLFCTQGVFMECRWSKSHRHHYHKLCGVATNDGIHTVCPHCGTDEPAVEVLLEIKLARKPVVYLEQHQERKTVVGARMGWSKREMATCRESTSPELDLGDGKCISSGKLAPGLDRERLQAAIVSLSQGKQHNIKCNSKSLYWATKHGDLEKVLHIVSSGLDPSIKVKDCHGQTALHMAATTGNVAIAHVLVMAGAALDLCDASLHTPLMIAIHKHHNPVVQYLVTAGADLQMKTSEGMTSLHLAAKLGNLTACRHLLDNGRLSRHAINVQDDGGWTPLVWASENRHINVVKFLLERGANPQLCDVEQNTALHWAALSGCTRVCAMLLDRGCSLRSMNAHGDTPLHIAARQNHRDAVVLLLARGARLDCLNTKNETPLQCAQEDSEVLLQLTLNAKLRDAIDQATTTRSVVLSGDIAAGKEQVPIPCINDVDDCGLPGNYLYVADNTEASNINIDRSITSLKWCQCTDGCNTGNCGCAQLNFRCWYDPDGRLLPDFNYIDPPMIFECNRACGCNKLSCNNRVVQHGITAHLQLFRTPDKGWGVRPMKKILKGSYVCEYVGEVITDLEADQREDDSYLFDLDNRDTETFCLDARNFGNVARFINHLCAPNLTPVKMFLDHQDLSFPRIALFANRDIEAEEELGFDYGEKFWVVKYKQFTCTCGGSSCRFSAATIHSTLERYYEKQRDTPTPRDRSASNHQ